MIKKLFKLWTKIFIAQWAIYGISEGIKEIPWEVAWKYGHKAKEEKCPFKHEHVLVLIKRNFDYMIEGFRAIS